MDPNHPDRAEDSLLASARSVLVASSNLFEVKPWREIMAKNAAAVAKAKEVKAAAKTVEANGTAPYKHEPAADAKAEPAAALGGHSVFNQEKTTAAEADAKAKAEKAEKAAKEKADREAKAAAVKKELAEAKAAREAKAAEAKAAREAKAAEAKAAGRNYVGPMLALADRVKQGVYVKSTLGQMRSNDELAIALDTVPPQGVITLGMLLFGGENKYAHLNIGQQSMNFRNRIRGALKRGDVEVKLGDTPAKLTIDLVKELVAANKLSIDVAAEKAAKEKEAAAKKAAKEKEAAEKKAALEAAAKKAAAEKIEKAKAMAPKGDGVTDDKAAVQVQVDASQPAA